MKKLKVGINARLLEDGAMRGWNRYTVNLVRALARTDQATLYLISENPVSPEYQAIFDAPEITKNIKQITSGPMFYPKWQENWLPRMARVEKLDILHTPYHFGLPMFAPCVTVATLHDAIDMLEDRSWADYFNPRSILSRFYLWETRIRSDCIITVSQFSAQELTEYTGVQKSKIRIISEAADPQFKSKSLDEIQPVLNRYGLRQKPYVFYVGGLEKRKNLTLLINALKLIRSDSSVSAVIAGGSASDADQLKQEARALNLSDRVEFLGKVPDSDLPALYAGAMGLVYPSRHEGFGLQLVEAMGVGCPILSSSSSSLPEVAGESAAYFSPENTQELAKLILRHEHDDLRRTRLAQSSKARGLQFCWEKTANETLSVYRDLLAKA
jgi:glycosyltransferase involved in cell wall biosynthesis